MSRLDSPIFVTYINIGGCSRTRAEKIIQDFANRISPVIGESNIFIPIENGENRVELLWPGTNNFGDISKMKVIKNIVGVLDDTLSLIRRDPAHAISGMMINP